MMPPKRSATHPPYELFMDELLRIPLLGTGVKIALAAAPFSWFRGGPARAMGHLGEYPEAALLHVHRLRLALQLARLLSPQAPDKSTVAVIMTIKNLYLFFLVGWRVPTRTANLIGSSSSGTTRKRPPRVSPACNARGRRCSSSSSSRPAHCR